MTVSFREVVIHVVRDQSLQVVTCIINIWLSAHTIFMEQERSDDDVGNDSNRFMFHMNLTLVCLSYN